MRGIIFASALSLISLTAYAQSTAGVGYKIAYQGSGGKFCMDVTGNKDTEGNHVQLWQCHGRENQRWTVTTANNGGSAIIGPGGYCLDVRGAKESAGTAVQLWKCHFQANQRFIVGSDGTIKEEQSGKCLQPASDKAAATIVLAACTNSPKDKWKLEP